MIIVAFSLEFVFRETTSLASAIAKGRVENGRRSVYSAVLSVDKVVSYYLPEK